MEVGKVLTGGVATYGIYERGMFLGERALEHSKNVDVIAKDVYTFMNPGKEPTEAELDELINLIRFRYHDKFLKGTYSDIDEALVKTGHATNVETAGTENSLLEAAANNHSDELAVFGLIVLGVITTSIAVHGLFSRVRRD